VSACVVCHSTTVETAHWASPVSSVIVAWSCARHTGAVSARRAPDGTMTPEQARTPGKRSPRRVRSDGRRRWEDYPGSVPYIILQLPRVVSRYPGRPDVWEWVNAGARDLE
jgi:hypothetical protein